jgi:hypothetical protein
MNAPLDKFVHSRSEVDGVVRGWLSLVVLAKATEFVQPGKCALNDPAFGST